MARTRKGKLKPTRPLSIRLTEEERAALEQAAVGMGMGEYVRSRLFGGVDFAPRRRGKTPVKDHEALGQILGHLGASGVAHNLSELSEAARSGSLPVTPETEQAFLKACADIQAVKAMLMAALGVGGRNP